VVLTAFFWCGTYCLCLVWYLLPLFGVVLTAFVWCGTYCLCFCVAQKIKNPVHFSDWLAAGGNKHLQNVGNHAVMYTA